MLPQRRSNRHDSRSYQLASLTLVQPDREPSRYGERRSFRTIAKPIGRAERPIVPFGDSLVFVNAKEGGLVLRFPGEAKPEVLYEWQV